MAHSGGVSKIQFYSDSDNSIVLSSGLKDGVLNIFDMRTQNPVFKDIIHGGAINFLAVTSSGNIITASADKTVKLFEIGH